MPAAKPAFPQLNLSHPFAQGLVGAWPFHEGSGTVINDLSGQLGQGIYASTAGAAPTWGAGPNGYAFTFNGLSAKRFVVSPGKELELTSSMSIAFWMKSSSNAAQVWFGSYGTSSPFTGWGVGTSLDSVNSNHLSYWSSGTASWVGSTISVCDGNWHHCIVIASKISGAVFFFVDGALSGSVGSYVPPAGGSGVDKIIGNSAPGGNPVIGSLDSFYVWNRPLSYTEVTQLNQDHWIMFRRRRVLHSSGSSSGAGTAPGDSSASAVGRDFFNAAGTAPGTSTASGVGHSLFFSVASAPGDSTASAVGKELFFSVASGPGDSTASATGVALFFSVGTANGTSSASGVAPGSGPAAGTAPGTSSASAVGVADFLSVGTAPGDSTAAATTKVLFLSVGTAPGDSTASAAGVALVRSVGTANGDSTASAVPFVLAGMLYASLDCQSLIQGRVNSTPLLSGRLVAL